MTIESEKTNTYPDGTVVHAIYYDDNTPPLVTITPGPNTREANRQLIKESAHLAINLNIAFLNLLTPTNAQVFAQVRLLTREVNALIRLLLDNNALDNVSDKSAN